MKRQVCFYGYDWFSVCLWRMLPTLRTLNAHSWYHSRPAVRPRRCPPVGQGNVANLGKP